MTEHISNPLSGDLTVCPRVVSLKSPGTIVRVPVRVSQISIMFTDKVSVFDSLTPDLPQKQETKSSTSEDLGVQIDEDNLTPDQLTRA